MSKLLGKKVVIEGSLAVAEAVKYCRPNVISALPHHATDAHRRGPGPDGGRRARLKAEFVNTESEFRGRIGRVRRVHRGRAHLHRDHVPGPVFDVRVLYNIAGSRLPIVLTCANRAVSAPISIWNDQQDSLAVRDAGWIQVFCEDAQEIHDFQPIAFKVAENPKVRLPFMTMLDGFVNTHTYEQPRAHGPGPGGPVPAHLQARWVRLDPRTRLTFGALAMPDVYPRDTLHAQRALMGSMSVYADAVKEFKRPSAASTRRSSRSTAARTRTSSWCPWVRCAAPSRTRSTSFARRHEGGAGQAPHAPPAAQDRDPEGPGPRLGRRGHREGHLARPRGHHRQPT